MPMHDWTRVSAGSFHTGWIPLEATYCAAREAIPARWRRLLSE
jgi:hypothetical protein